MANASPMLKGVIHGKTIELESEPGLPDGQEVSVEIHPVSEPPGSLERLDVDPAVRPGKYVIKGTRLLVDDLVLLAEQGRTDDELLARHPELTPEDVAAVRHYALVPAGLRRSFGSWAEDADELDEYLEWTRQQRKVAPGDRGVSFLLDTDICSAFMKGKARVYNRFIQYGGRLHISTVTQAELFVWALRAKASPHRWQSLLDLLKEVIVLPVDETVARKFGEVRAWQLDHGLATPDLDLLNASVALSHGLTLVTHNTQDFANIPGLTLADWLMP